MRGNMFLSLPEKQGVSRVRVGNEGIQHSIFSLLALLFVVSIVLFNSLPVFAAPFALRVNFYPTTSSSVPSGYQQDNGLSYASRVTGYTYGWVGNTPTMAAQSNSLTTDPRGANNPSLPAWQAQPSQKYLARAAFTTGSWEAQVPNGQYSVRVVSGDAATFGAYSLSVEGIATVSGTTTSSNSWLDQTVSVRVNDGKLTISAPSGNGRLNFIEITQVRMNTKVDFRPASAPNVTGYLTDDSSAYAAQPSGYTYGWSAADANAAFTRTPDATVAASALNTPVNNTVVVAGTRKWEMEVLDGIYRVRVVAGDSSGSNLGAYQCAVEGITFVDGTLDNTTAANHFIDRTTTVVVSDGKLTLGIPDGAPVGTKLHLALVEISDEIPVAVHKPVPGWIQNQPVVGAGGSGSSAGPSAANSVNLASGVYENTPGADIVVRNPVGPDVSFTRFYTSSIARKIAAVATSSAGGYADSDYDESGDYFGPPPSPSLPTYPTLNLDRLTSSRGLSAGWLHEYDVVVTHPRYFDYGSGASTVSHVLTIRYPDGGRDTLNAELNQQGVPTGKLVAPPGVPYVAFGTYDAAERRWTQVSIVGGDGSRMIFAGFFDGAYGNSLSALRLSQIQNMLGQAVKLTWNDNHQLTKIANLPSAANNQDNRTLLTITYPSSYPGNVVLTSTYTIPPNTYNRIVNLSFDAERNLVKVSNIGDSKTVWRYSYETRLSYQENYGWNVQQLPLLTTVSKPKPDGSNAEVTSWVNYDTMEGYVRTVKDANGNTDQYLYQPGNQTIVNTQEATTGKILSSYTQKFDPANGNRSTETVDADGNPAGVEYNTAYPHAPFRATNENGQKIEATYDAWGNVTDSLYPNGNGTGSGLLRTHTAYEYDTNSTNPLYPIGRVTYVSQVPNGTEPSTAARKTSYTYYASGLLESVRTPAPYGAYFGSNPSWYNGTVVTRYEYTASPSLIGNTKKVYKPQSRELFSFDQQLPTTVYEYFYDSDPDPNYPYVKPGGEALGEPVAIKDPLGHITHYRYDDGRGNLTASIDAVGNRTDFEYNIEDQVVRVIYPATGQTGSGRGYTLYTYAYIGGPLLTTGIYNESGVRVNKTDSEKGAEAETTQVSGGAPTVKVGYDGTYRVSSIADGKNQTTTVKYDKVGNVTQVNYPTGGGKIDWTSFDKVGNPLQQVDGKGQTANYTRLATNNAVTGISYPGKEDDNVTYEYDIYGRITRATNNNGYITYQYDDLDNITSRRALYKTFNEGTRSFNNVGDAFFYCLDGKMRLDSAANTNYKYDLAGRLEEVRTPGFFSNVQIYVWSDNNWLLKAISKNCSDTLDSVSSNDTRDFVKEYTYDARGNRVSVTNYSIIGVSGGGLQNRYYSSSINGSYDALGNLVSYQNIFHPQSKTPTYAGETVNVAFGYDDRNRVVSDSQSGTYQYDAAGNITNFAGTSFSFNDNNQLSGGQFTYDNNGNPTLYKGYTMSFDTSDRLTQIGSDIKYAYLPDGARAWKEVSSPTGPTYRRYYLTSNGLVIGESGNVSNNTSNTWGGYLHLRYRYGADGVYESNKTNEAWTEGRTIPFYDLVGNCVQRVSVVHRNFGGGLMSQHLYSAYGQFTQQYVADPVYTQPYPFLYKGQYGYHTDADTGLIYCQNRFYDPATGRWLTRDPIGYEGGINLYAYCDGNPVMRVDPNGLDWLDDQANFWAGAGDSLTFGGTGLFRSLIGVNDVVNEGSGAYIAGMYTEMAVEIAASGGSAALKAASRNAARRVGSTVLREAATAEAKRVFPAAFTKSAKLDANGTKVLTKSGRQSMTQASIVHHNNPLAGHPWNLTGNVVRETLFPLRGLPATFNSGRWNLKAFANTAAGKAAHEATHIGMMKLENILMKGFNRYTIPARVVRNGYSRATNP